MRGGPGGSGVSFLWKPVRIRTNLADAQAETERAAYETRLDAAPLAVETVSAQVAEADVRRVAAEATATTAHQDAIDAQALADQSASRLETAHEAVAVAQLAVNDRPDQDTPGRR